MNAPDALSNTRGASATPRRIAVLGATGSVGVSTLDVVRRHRDQLEVFALAARRNWALLAAQCKVFRPRVAALEDPRAARELARELAGSGIEVVCGAEAIAAVAAAAEVDTVIAAIVGGAGFRSSLAAVRAGKRVLLANKEALVMGGALFVDAVRTSGATLLPLDSEHNAIFQCLQGNEARAVRRIVLTASGGPFRTRDPATLATVTPEEACAHPTWSMGRKISVDSATMMNKGLEVIEAHWLFGLPGEAIDVVIHPQSIVHSLVEYVDGSMLAQLGHPDMRIPIAYALAHPSRLASGAPMLDLAAIGRLEFEALDHARFPCLALAREALAAGGAAPLTLSAANEVAVEAFLEGAIGYTDIAAICGEALSVLARAGATAPADAEAVMAADGEARVRTRELLGLPRPRCAVEVVA